MLPSPHGSTLACRELHRHPSHTEHMSIDVLSDGQYVKDELVVRHF